ncbi:MAG: hypothetical protein RRY97_08595 [Oscillibacter sp.]
MDRFMDCVNDADRDKYGQCAAGMAQCYAECPHYFKKKEPPKYGNVRAYLDRNTDGSMDRFAVTATRQGDKEPGLLHLMIHPEGRSGETADFLLHADGTEEFTQKL